MSELWEHQKSALEKMRERNYYALFMEMGTGKTRVTIEHLRHLCNKHGKLLRVLIFAPLSVCPQWKQEILKFSKIKEENIHVLTMPGRARVEAIKRISSGVVITNYEAVNITAFYAELILWHAEVLICDEIHLCKSSQTSRSKKVYALAQSIPYRYGLTGTPIINSAMDIFSQYRILDLGKSFGTNFFLFKKLYCVDKNAWMPKHKYFPKWVVRPESEKMFASVMAETSHQAKKKDCLDLPPLLKINTPVEMGSEQAKLYEMMKREFVAELEGTVATAEFAMTKSLRLQQIICGFIQGSSEEDAKWVRDNPRLDALEELLEGIGSNKCIVWTCFRPTYAKIGEICAKLKLSYAFLTGLESAKEKEESLEKFRNGTQILISNPASGGTGLSMEFSSYSIYFARSYNLSHYLQSEARNHRGGSEQFERISHYHLVATGTLDEAIASALNGKRKIGDAILYWAGAK